MSRLQQLVAEALSSQGPLAIRTLGFQAREAQQQMAEAVARTLEVGGQLVVEAGTGVGKTFAYLVPVLLSGQRALISTATKALQDQLFSRDIPRLLQMLHLPVRVALLKGRGSYLCLHRLQQARHHDTAVQPAQARALTKVEMWSQSTRTGDLAELTGLDERSPMIPLFTSTRDNCLGSNCPQHKACHVNLARREAMAADLVVINHHLFFADMAVRESGVAELLPSVRATVFDEAHQLNEIGVHFLGKQLSGVQLIDLSRDVLGTGLTLARGLADWQGLAASLDRATRDWRLAVGASRGLGRLRWVGDGPETVDEAAWAATLETLGAALEALLGALDSVTELAPDFVQLLQRTKNLIDSLFLFTRAPASDRVRWLEVGTHLRLVESPLDIADAFRKWMMPLSIDGSDVPLPTDSAAVLAQKAWVFTSATLGDDEALSWFTEPCGLGAAEVLRVGSPFDYPAQAGVYVPTDLARPSDPAHPRQVAMLAAQGAAALGGRTLVLTTTLSAMRAIADVLVQTLGGQGQVEVLVQGQWPKRRLMERFRQGTQDGLPGCVLVASASFWEGFDVPGDALQLVIIDKLPFPPPNDPLVEARSHRLSEQGRSPFADHALPEAVIALKQGAGRLIRSETDRGVLVVCDTRMKTMGYGKRLRKALPPMRWIESREEYLQVLEAFTKASTTDPCAENQLR